MFIELQDATLFSIAFGRKKDPVFLALSGWIGSWEDWAATLALLSQDWRTVSYDHRGSGATISPVESISLDRLVDDVFAVLDAYDVENCVLGAMSAGAAVAVKAARRDPKRIKGLVLVNALDFRAPPHQTSQFLDSLRTDYSRTLESFITACVPEENAEPVKRWGRQILERASQEAAIALYRMAASVDMRRDPALVTQKTLILHGDTDPIVPLEAAEWLADEISNARLVVIQGAGHVPIMTRPDEVARAVREFFRPASSP